MAMQFRLQSSMRATMSCLPMKAGDACPPYLVVCLMPWASGGAMTLRLDLITEPVGEPAAFEGEAVIDLQAGVGGRAVNAVRRCAESEHDHRAEAK